MTKCTVLKVYQEVQQEIVFLAVRREVGGEVERRADQKVYWGVRRGVEWGVRRRVQNGIREQMSR